MTGKAIPIHNAALHPHKAYAHTPIEEEPIAPPKKKIAMNSLFNRLQISDPNEKSNVD
ncbi:hypothetical protein BLGI_4264 [Brevibacillus laterosporus GI-9]|nr:hypothetical protein BLGI_4264 [Brevibacillus laterosporus GI-9]